ncbi:MAG TPA: nucleotidyl transferase AbiEii/AbiGii toxin family protein [Acidimicrobiales bacterium]|nr:nucleotidyl transferase AbiEii/AbiGii toxin family protein [Acidimicrobiales bacterium]
MTEVSAFGNLAPKIVSLHEMLGSIGVPHQFGGAIALAWYRNPRATTDIDINLTVPPAAAPGVLGALAQIGVTVTAEDLVIIDRDGQIRLNWDGAYLDVFFAIFELHQEMAELARTVRFVSIEIPILAPEHLVVCKAIFDRPKDWLDIEEIIRWGTELDAALVLKWVAFILRSDAPQYQRLVTLIGAQA